MRFGVSDMRNGEASRMDTISLTLLLDAPSVCGIPPTSQSTSSLFSGSGSSSPSSFPLVSLKNHDGGVASRVSFHDMEIGVPNDSTTNSSMLQLVRKDLGDAIGFCYNVAVSLTATGESSSLVEVAMVIVPWCSERDGLLTMENTVEKLVTYVIQRKAFSSLCTFIGNSMKPSCILSINAVRSTLNGISFSSLRSQDQAKGIYIGKSFETQLTSPLLFYWRELLPGGELENASDFIGTTGLPNREELMPMRKGGCDCHGQARHSYQKSSPSQSMSNTESSFVCRESSGSVSPSPVAAFHRGFFSPPEFHPVSSGNGRTSLGCRTPLLSPAFDGVMARRTQVHLVSLLPKPVNLKALQGILVSAEAVLALREDIVDHAFIDCCKPDDVQIDVKVHPEGRERGDVSYGSSDIVAGRNSSCYCGTFHVAVGIPMHLELVAICALADHLLAPHAFAAWQDFVRRHIGEAYTSLVLDVANTYVNGLPVAFLEDFLSKCSKALGTSLSSAVAGRFLAAGEVRSCDDEGDQNITNYDHALSQLRSSSELPTPEVLSVVPHAAVCHNANSSSGVLNVKDEVELQQRASIMVQDTIERRRSLSHQETVESNVSEPEELPPLASPMFLGVNLKTSSTRGSSIALLKSIIDEDGSTAMRNAPNVKNSNKFREPQVG